MAAEQSLSDRPGVAGRLATTADDLIRASPPARVTARAAAAVAAVAVASPVLLLARQRGPGALDTIWAEDGSIFLAQARALGAAGSILEPYGGYMNAVPRLAALVVAALPLSAADAGFAAVSVIVVTACSLFVYRASSSHLSSRWARVAVSAPMVLGPLGGTEILANASNLHWYLLYAAFWAALWRPPSRWESALAVVVVSLAVLSDPFALILWPLIGLRLAGRLGRVDAVAAAFAVVTVVQLGVVAGGRGQRQLGEPTNPFLVPFRYVVDVLGRGLVGDRFVGASGLEARGAAVGGAVLIGLAGLAYARREAVRARLPLLLALSAVSVAYFAAPVVLSGFSTPRYGLAPALLVIAAVVVVVEDADLRLATRPAQVLAGGALLLVAICWAVGLPSLNDREQGPAWDDALEAAAAGCTGASETRVPVTPRGWEVALPCPDVVDAAAR